MVLEGLSGAFAIPSLRYVLAASPAAIPAPKIAVRPHGNDRSGRGGCRATVAAGVPCGSTEWPWRMAGWRHGNLLPPVGFTNG